MKTLVPFIWLAGAVQLVIAGANFIIPSKLEYAANLAKVTKIVRQVFIIHAVYIVGLLVAFAALCFGFAPELASGRGLGRALSLLLAVFWGARLPIQLFYYDPAMKRHNRTAHLFFATMFAYLTVVFAVATMGGG